MSEDAPVGLQDDQFVVQGFNSSATDVAQHMVDPSNLDTIVSSERIHEDTNSLSFRLTNWNDRLTRLEGEIEEYRGKNSTPDWYNDRNYFLSQIVSQIKEEPTLQNVTNYWSLLDREEKTKQQIYDNYPSRDVIVDVMFNLGSENMARVLSEDPIEGTLKTAFVDFITVQAKSDYLGSDVCSLLVQVYNLSSGIELFGLPDDGFIEKVKPALMHSAAIRALVSYDKLNDNELTYEAKKELFVSWIAKGLTGLTGIDEEEARKYSSVASKEGITAESIVKLYEHATFFGKDRISAITEATGIYGLSSYSKEQLERMERFALDPEGFADKLKDHDVIVSVVNALGDHNNVLRGSSTLAEDGTNRTLFFEIASIADLYKYMSRLEKVGIKPSTLLISAHGNEGLLFFDDLTAKDGNNSNMMTIDDKLAVKEINQKRERPNRKTKSFSSMSFALNRLVDGVMRPSRGIDDDSESKGRIKIILNSCLGGKRIEAKRQQSIVEQTQNSADGLHSVASTIASELAQRKTAINVDIYASSTSIQALRTEKGMVFTGAPLAGGGGRVKVKSIKVMYEGSSGYISETESDEITLRK